MRRPTSNAILLAGLIGMFAVGAHAGPAQRSLGPMRGIPFQVATPRVAAGVRVVRPMPPAARSMPPRSAAFGPLHFAPSGAPPNGMIGQGYFPGAPCLSNPAYSGSLFCRQYFPRGRARFGGQYFPALIYSGADYQSEPAVAESSAGAPAEEDPVVVQIANLTEEVRQLKNSGEDRQNSRPEVQAPAPTAAPAEAPIEKPISAVLVYRDGRKIEVDNYALRGQTLWVFLSQSMRKIPLSDLDLAQTRKLNEDRGVDIFTED